ncbi:MAG TPA: kelch repeat-containing protein [Myxococcaceae bacterium]|jgi:uncharacterized protein (TIGR03382 family)
MASLSQRLLSVLVCALLACSESAHRTPELGGNPAEAVGTGLDSLATQPSWSATQGMVNRRSHHTTTLLADGRIFVAGGLRDTSENPSVVESTRLAEVYEPATGQWSITALMHQSRYGHTATLLSDGRVLVAGGYAEKGVLSSVEIYDPVADTWTEGQTMSSPRGSHTATLLKSGEVLVVGGVSCAPEHAAELYAPDTDTWTTVGRPGNARAFHTASLLPDGKVLVVGGVDLSGGGSTLLHVTVPAWGSPLKLFTTFLKSAELFDPGKETWTRVGAVMNHARAGHTTTVLSDGKVIVVGGYEPQQLSHSVDMTMIDMQAAGADPLASAELYEPDKGVWSSRAPMARGRAFHTATLLPSGKLLVTAGNTAEPVTGGGTKLRSTGSTELYEPARDGWSSASVLPQPRVLHTATLLPGGRVLVMGGYNIEDPGKTGAFLTSSMFLEPVPRSWFPGDNLIAARHRLTATLLPGQGVLLTGGSSSRNGSQALASSEVAVYEAAGTSSSPMHQARYGHSATLMPNGKVLVAGGYANGKAVASSEVYDPETRVWTRTRSALEFARGGHTATLLSTGKVLVVGGGELSTPPIRAMEVYDPNTESWLTVGKTSLARIGHTATQLPNGRVLVAGGRGGSDAGATITPVPDLYDPISNNWFYHGERMLKPRVFHTATLLEGGRVLVAGGEGENGELLDSAELYDPSTRLWSSAGTMSSARSAHSATLLPTGQVLVTGGYGADGSVLASAELYDPASGSWTAAEPMSRPRVHHAAVLLPDGSLLVAGGDDSSSGPSSSEQYRALVSQGQNPAIIRVSRNNVNGPSHLEPGDELLVEGVGFRGQSEASSGDRGSSAANFPLLTLRSIDSGQWIQLRTSSFSDTSARAALLHVQPKHALPPGYYVLTVTTHGQTATKEILIRNFSRPELTLDAFPSKTTRDTRVSFSFSLKAEDLQFIECSGSVGWVNPCSSPISRDNLREGPNSFMVRAVDWAGNESTLTYAWEVDTRAPDITLGWSTAAKTRETSASFTFFSKATDLVAFECSLDGAAFKPCSSPMAHEGLLRGRHTFRVQARDQLGNVTPVPVSYSWTIMSGYYDAGCSASGASPGQYWPWALLLLGLRRRLRLSRGSSPAAAARPSPWRIARSR